jgi:putative salt-induced outer membrane protein
MRRLFPAVAAAAILAPRATVAQADTARMKFTGDIGYVSTSGNTSVTTLNVGDKFTWRTGSGMFTQTAAVIYGKTSGTESANNQLFRARYDWPVLPRLAVYAFGGYERNKYGGIASRFDESAGLAYQVIRSATDLLDFEAGVGFVQESRYTTPERNATISNSFPSARSAAMYKHLFTKDAYFQQLVEYLPNLETTSEYRLNSESAVVAPISSHIGLKMSGIIRYNAAPPQPELRKTDRIISAGLQITY